MDISDGLFDDLKKLINKKNWINNRFKRNTNIKKFKKFLN